MENEKKGQVPEYFFTLKTSSSCSNGQHGRFHSERKSKSKCPAAGRVSRLRRRNKSTNQYAQWDAERTPAKKNIHRKEWRRLKEKSKKKQEGGGSNQRRAGLWQCGRAPTTATGALDIGRLFDAPWHPMMNAPGAVPRLSPPLPFLFFLPRNNPLQFPAKSNKTRAREKKNNRNR